MENIKTAVHMVMSKYATFTGRASRSEFWWWVLAVLITLLVVGVVDAILFGTGPEAGQPISSLISLGLLIPNIAVGVRRMHDIGKSGWWLLIAFIPVVGFFVLLYFYVQPSQPEANEYGAPKPFHAG